MDYQKVHDEILDKGMSLFPFPENIQNMMYQEICRYLSQYSKGENASSLTVLQQNIFSLDDDEFIREFSKPKRNFRDEVCSAILKWSREEFSKIFVGKQVAVNSLGLWETENLDYLHKKTLSVYWRCVRPNKTSDIGAPHRDSTFWGLSNAQDYDPQIPFEYKHRWKVWLPIFGCNKENSLQLVPNSHQENIEVKVRMTEFGERPDIDPSWLLENEKRFTSPCDGSMGQCIIFHDDMVHKGVLNRSENLRISAEFSVLTD